MNFNFFHRYNELISFLKSTDFNKALILGIGISLPIIISSLLGFFEVGLAISLGVLLSSPSDVNGSFRHRNIGIILSACIAVIANLIGGYVKFNTWFLLPLLGIIMFIISYFAVYGFRASLIAFSGLFALVLSFANISDVLEVFERSALIGCGGLFYLFLSFLRQKINPKAQTEQFLSQTMSLTSRVLQIRSKLISPSTDRKALQKSLLDLQAELNENHETLRDILISSRKSSGNSNYERNRLLILIQLVDMYELAISNPVNYDKMDLLLKEHPHQILCFQELISQMSERLHVLSESLDRPVKLLPVSLLELKLKETRECLKDYKNKTGNKLEEAYLMLQNLLAYQEKQVQLISKIERILNKKEVGEGPLLKKDEEARFLNQQDYSYKILLENLTLKSAIFKHSLRLAIVVMVGYSIGALLEVNNSYWILLTIIVIMRPNYGLTKTRSKQRITGTLIGAAIAVGIVLLIQNPVFYAIIAFVTLILAFAMVQRNYKTSAVFITLSVVFIYALLQPNVLDVIQYRVLDTVIGAGLAAAGNLFLWPSWESSGVRVLISESIEANKKYLEEIVDYYQKKGKLPTSYKLSRKTAFISLGNLSSAFQRMTQEPKSKQLFLDDIYELLVLNHTFLTSLASMGTFIQNQTTTKASIHFQNFAENIAENLQNVISLINNSGDEEIPKGEKQAEAEAFFEEGIRDLYTLIGSQENLENIDSSEIKLKEIQLITEQLKWLLDISEKIHNKLKTSRIQ